MRKVRISSRPCSRCNDSDGGCYVCHEADPEPETMTTSLFLRTYDKDAEWLRYCLRSLDKFGDSFNQRVIVTPESSHEAIHPIAKEFGWDYDVCPPLAADDYIGQQGTKLTADNWCNSDNICYIDSDLVFTQPFSPTEIVDDDGRIILLKTRYDTIVTPWQPITEQAVGFPVGWEYMRRFPLAYPSRLLKLTRSHLEKTHGKSFEEFMRGIKGRHFSEFNVLGAIAEKVMPKSFDFLDTNSGRELPPSYVKQFWSWGGVTPEIKAEIETILQ